MTIVEIIGHTAEAFGVTRHQIRGRERTRHIAIARQCAMYFARKGGRSYPMIGRHFNRHHSTVLVGVKGFPERARREGYASEALDVMNAVTGDQA